MVAIGDEDFPLLKCSSDGRIQRGVRTAPERLVKAAAGGRRERSPRTRAPQQVTQLAVGAVIQAEDRAETGQAGVHELQAVCFGSCQRPLMRQHLPLIERFQAHGGKDALADIVCLTAGEPLPMRIELGASSISSTCAAHQAASVVRARV